jgi:hypothetical protein
MITFITLIKNLFLILYKVTTYEVWGDKTVVFTVRNSFVLNLIRRHCLAEINAALAACGYLPDPSFVVCGLSSADMAGSLPDKGATIPDKGLQPLAESKGINPLVKDAPPKQEAAITLLDRLKESKQKLSAEDWQETLEHMWSLFTPEKIQEVLESLPAERRDELLAMISLPHCHRLGIIEAKRKLIKRSLQTA